MSRRFTRLAGGLILSAMTSTMIVTGTAHAATAPSSPAPSSSQVHLTRTLSPGTAAQNTIVVSLKATSIPKDVTVVRVGGQTLLTAKGTVGARVVSPGYAATKAALAHRSGAVTLLLAGQGTKGAATAPPGVKATPQFVGYGCLVQPWPRTNVHPCGYVIGNSVAQGIFNALKLLGSGVAIAVCTGILVGLGDNPGQAGTVCATAVGIAAGFFNLGSKCLFIVTTPSWLAGQILAVNC